MIDERQISDWCEWLHSYAGKVTQANRLPDPGMIQLTAVHPTMVNPRTGGNEVSFPRYKIGDVKGMVDFAVYWGARGWNIYVQGRTIRSDLDRRKSPKLEDTAWVFAFVGDYDGYGNRSPAESFAVQTSPGHEHSWCLTSMSLEGALAISPRYKLGVGADSDSGVIAQDYRLPGTPNYPTPKKITAGRQIEPTFVIPERWSGRFYSVEKLDALLPPLPNTSPVVSDLPTTVRTPAQILEVMLERAGYAYKLFTLPMGDRSAAFVKACWIAFTAGLTPSEVECFILNEAKNGCARKWIDRGQLREQLTKQWHDWSAKQKPQVG